MEVQDVPREHAVGVLFVHGIGEQVRGHTLDAFGEPLIALLRRLTRRRVAATDDDHDHVATSRSIVGGAGHRPPTWQIRFCDAHPSAAAPGTWVLAESYWADLVEAPRYRELAWWGLKVLPLTAALHVIALGRQRWSRDHFAEPVGVRAVSSWAGRLLLLPAMAGLALLGTVGVAVLTIAGLVPFVPLRRWVRALQWKLSESLGDSYVFIERMRGADTIRARVAHDLAWLRQRCDRVAVVAHSQGAAIAHRVLRDEDDRDDVLFISVGSGLGKLHDIRSARTEERKMVAAGWAFLVGIVALLIWPPVLLSLVYGAYDVPATGWRPSWHEAAMLATVFLSLGAGMAFDYLRDRYERRDRELVLRGLPWLDVYASADPVSNGALLSSGGAHTEVTNCASVLRDHTGYTRNRDEFAALLALELSTFGGVGLATPSAAELERFRAQRRRRAWRGRVFRWTRRATLVGAGLVVAATWPQLHGLGVRVGELVLTFGTRVEWAVVGWFAQRPDAVAFAATWALAVAAVGAWLLPLAVTEAAMDHHDSERFLDGSPVDAGGWPLALHVAVPSVALAVGVVALAAPDLAAFVTSVSDRLVLLLPAAGGAVLFASAMDAEEDPRPADWWLRDLARAAAAGTTGVVVGWFAVGMWPAAFPHPFRTEDFGVTAGTAMVVLAVIAVAVARVGERRLAPALARRISAWSVRLPIGAYPAPRSAGRQELVTALVAGLVGAAIGVGVDAAPVAALGAVAGAATAGLGTISARRRTYHPADRLVVLEIAAMAAAVLALVAPVIPRLAEWGASFAELGRVMWRPGIIAFFELVVGAVGAVDGLGLLAGKRHRSELLEVRVASRFRLPVGTVVLTIGLTATWAGVLHLRGRPLDLIATTPLWLLLAFALLHRAVAWIRRPRTAWGRREQVQREWLGTRVAAMRRLLQRVDELSRLTRLHPCLDPDEVDRLMARIDAEMAYLDAQQEVLAERREHGVLQRAT